MLSWLMHNTAHWVTEYAGVLAVLVTVAVAVLLFCCLQCTNCPGRDKDDLFKHRQV